MKGTCWATPGRLSVTLEDLQSGRFYQSLVP